MKLRTESAHPRGKDGERILWMNSKPEGKEEGVGERAENKLLE